MIGTNYSCAVCFIVGALASCSPASKSSSTAHPMAEPQGAPPLVKPTLSSTPATREAAGSNAAIQSTAGSVASAPPVLPKPEADSSATVTGALGGCQPGHYVGTYDSELGDLGMGPITFDLMAAASTPASSVPCQEFCPGLVTNAEGGTFTGSWFGFDATGMIAGGLDCKSGEFRAEFVNGHYAPSGADPKDVDFLGFTGKVEGSFMGKFKTSAMPGPGIEGMFMLTIHATLDVDVEGTFTVQRMP